MKKVLHAMSWRVRLLAVIAVAAIAVVVGVLVVQAEPVPRTFAYQGVLTDDAGNPITGSHAITIRVYADDATGTALCTEAETVTVTNGLFRMVVGDGGCTVDPSWFTRATPVFLGITVDTATLTPRTPLLPVASAYQAEHAETAGGMIVTSGGRSISVGGVYCGATAAMSGSLGGYTGAKALCETACGDSAAHMCSTEEIVRSAQLMIGIGGAWFAAGSSPIFVGGASCTTTCSLNDCQGWTTSNTWSAGSTWSSTAANYMACNTSQPVACCL